MRLFVYGSLMQGEDNAGEICGGALLGPARTRAAYTLVDLGPYPALLAGGDAAIAGELYDVDEPLLARLDAFEDHPAVFCRQAITLADGSEAQAYFFAGVPPLAARISSGDWRRR